MHSTTVTLSSGLALELREPTAGDLRGIKLLDVLQLDTAAHAPLLERLGALTALEFYALSAADAMAVMTGVVGFLAPQGVETSDSPSA